MTVSKDPIAWLGDPAEWPECEEFHLELTTDRLAPLEVARNLTANALDDLDNRAKAITYGWHEGEKLEQDIMAIAVALPKLTAELRRRACS